jgi:hypothetical protein
MLMVLSAIFSNLNFQTALWVTAGCFGGVGLLEVLLGPRLFLVAPPLAQQEEEPLMSQHA